MCKIINGKKLLGFTRADGIHYVWGEEDVAVIDQLTGEIEWYNRKFHFPEAVVAAIREEKRAFYPKASYRIDVKRTRISATQGSIHILINDNPLISFGDEFELRDGKWVSKIPDEELGRLVISAFWHPHDGVCHYSDNAKRAFYPAWEPNSAAEAKKSTY